MLFKMFQSQHTYELVSNFKTDNVNIEKNPSYSVTGVQDGSLDHHYDVIPGSDACCQD